MTRRFRFFRFRFLHPDFKGGLRFQRRDDVRVGLSINIGHYVYGVDWETDHARSAHGGCVVPRGHGDDVPVVLSSGMPAEEIVEHYGEDLALRLNERSPDA